MGKNIYKYVNWKVYCNINNGKVLNILNPKKDHRSNLFGFSHNMSSVMNYGNNRLYATELIDTFDKAKVKHKELVRIIMDAIKADEPSIEEILK